MNHAAHAVNDYIFDEKGTLVRIVKNDKAHRLIIETSSGTTEYRFADSVNDPADIDAGKITKVISVSEERIISILMASGALDKNNGFWYCYNEGGGGGNLDFSLKLYKYFDVTNDPQKNASTIFIATGDSFSFNNETIQYAHNHMNFGNFLIGAAFRTLGVSLSTGQYGAHYNSLFGRANGYGLQFDSVDDQLSISRGYQYAQKRGW